MFQNSLHRMDSDREKQLKSKMRQVLGEKVGDLKLADSDLGPLSTDDEPNDDQALKLHAKLPRVFTDRVLRGKPVRTFFLSFPTQLNSFSN